MPADSSQVVTLEECKKNCGRVLECFVKELERRVKHWMDNSPLPLGGRPGVGPEEDPQGTLPMLFLNATLYGLLIRTNADEDLEFPYNHLSNPGDDAARFENSSGFKPGKPFINCYKNWDGGPCPCCKCTPLPQDETPDPFGYDVNKPPHKNRLGPGRRKKRCIATRTWYDHPKPPCDKSDGH